MNLQILIDMNLSPEWVACFSKHQLPAVHWSSVGSPTASDAKIMAWAAENQFIVFTHDLDFGALLALTRATEPSVIQLRTRQVLPEQIGPLVLSALRQFEAELYAGALVVIETQKLRARVLPF